MQDNNALHICIFGNERSIHVRRWVQGLRSLGHKVDLVTFIKDDQNDIGAINLNAPRKMDYITKILRLRSLIRKIRPDIFHAHYASSYGFLASFVNHPRKVLSVWGDDVVVWPNNNFVNKIMIKRSLARADHITATSQFLKRTAIKLCQLTRDITVIPFGIELDSLRLVARIPQPVVKIGIVKWLTYKYGIDYLIRAFEIIVKAGYNAELIVAGLGPDEADFRNLASELGLNDKITFYGYLNHGDLQKFLSSLEIFAMPSISDGESFGVAALEASATGLPVVATKVGGVPEVVVDGVTGLLVERKNVEQLAGALIQLIKSPELRNKLGHAGRKFVEANYDWKNDLKAMENVYREMMHK